MIEINLDVLDDLKEGYLLVDRCNYGDFDPQGIEMVPCVPSDLTNASDLMPCLVDAKKLSSDHRSLLVEILRQQTQEEHPFAICGWLDADVGIEELAEHIAGFISGTGPDCKNLLWRYFDPRVFSTTVAIFPDAQREALLGPIKKWRFTWFHRLWLVSGGEEDVDYLENFDNAWPNMNQWQTIFQSREINRVLGKFRFQKESKYNSLLEYQKIVIGYLFESVSKLNLDDQDDQVEFAYLCTKYGAAYREHPRLKAWWLPLSKGDISWSEFRRKTDKETIERF